MADEITGEGGESTASETSDVELLGQGEEETKEEVSETEEEKEEEAESESSDSETDEIETKESEEVTELTEEEKEIESKITRPSWEKLKEKYPEVVKDRELREIYFRDQQFSELFPNLESAKQAAYNAQLFEFFDTNLGTGDPKSLVDALDPRVADSFSENILPALYARDKNLFVRATGPYLSNLLNSVHEFAESKQDNNLKTSVLNLCKHLYGDFKLPGKPISRSHPEIEGEKQKLRQEREWLALNQKNDFTIKTEKIIGSRLDKILREDLNVKNSYTANSIVRDTIDRLKATLEQDQNFLNSMRNIFIQAYKSGYTSESQARVYSAYLARAKGLALKIRAEVKAQAIGKPSVDSEETKPKRVEGREKGSREDKRSKDLKNTREMSDLDILNMP